jgi:hypothetical protein
VSGTAGPDDPDDVTIWAGRLRAWPAAEPAPTIEHEAPDEGTRLSPRRRRAEPEQEPERPSEPEPESDTVLRPRSPAAAPTPAPAPPSVEPAHTDVDDRTELRAARPAAAAAEASAPADATELRPRTRREDTRRDPARTDAAASDGARVPEPLAREAYGPRRVDPVVAERRGVTSPRALDDAAPPTPARRRIGRPAIVGGAIALVAVLAAVTVAIVLLSL